MRKLISLAVILMLSLLAAQPVAAAPSASAADKSTKVIKLKIGSPVISINGKNQPLDLEGTVPVIENGITFVPVRAIFEALSADVRWNGETQTVSGIRGNLAVHLRVGSKIAYRNDEVLRLDTPPQIINGRTMVPVRFVAESMGADIKWDSKTQTVIITETKKFITLDNSTVYMEDTLAQVESILGKAKRIDPSHYDFEWHVYNENYSKFIMVGIKNGIVEAIYSNTKGFVTNNAKYGDTTVNMERGVTLYTDQFDNSKIHACLIISDNVVPETLGSDFFRAQELENFDVTNVFRVNYGLKPLAYDGTATAAARKHSQDMANKDYFAHINLEGLTPGERFKSTGGIYKGYGENIAAGDLLGINAFDGWVNSENHRSNILVSRQYMGVGHGYNAASTYKFYLTQFLYY